MSQADCEETSSLSGVTLIQVQRKEDPFEGVRKSLVPVSPMSMFQRQTAGKNVEPGKG